MSSDATNLRLQVFYDRVDKKREGRQEQKREEAANLRAQVKKLQETREREVKREEGVKRARARKKAAEEAENG